MSRRTFLYQATAAGVTAGVAPSALSQAAPSAALRVVDTHTHFYDPNREGGVPFPSKGTPLYRPVYPADWLAIAAPHGARETVVVEASPWLEDNQWILDLATNNKCVVGFVGNLLPHEADFAKNLKRFAANPIFRGIRVSGNLLEKANTPEFLSGAKLMADLNLELDINGPPVFHAHAAKLAATVPALRIVLNHVGISGDAAHLSDEWRSGLKSLGAQKNVFCKVSALTEQTDQSNKQRGSAPRDTAYYKPILDHCWECFGADRLIYGSNWPVCEKGGTYADQFKIVSEYFADKGRDASEKYFWKNSKTAYQWIER